MLINNIHRFEKLRDGGSLIVSFQSTDSCNYWLMFPISNSGMENPEFKAPVLVNRTTGVEVNIDLGGAKQLLDTLEPYFNQRPELPYVSKESETSIFDEMLSLCKVSA